MFRIGKWKIFKEKKIHNFFLYSAHNKLLECTRFYDNCMLLYTMSICEMTSSMTPKIYIQINELLIRLS